MSWRPHRGSIQTHKVLNHDTFGRQKVHFSAYFAELSTTTNSLQKRFRMIRSLFLGIHHRHALESGST